MTTQMTLGNFVKQLTLGMAQEKVVMLFKDESPWHLLFYRLKKDQSPSKPAFLRDLRFDWDGAYPRCQELSEFIQALHWTGSVVAANPSYEKITLQEDVRKVWAQETEGIPEELQAFIAHGVEIAKEEFPHHRH
jgi:hypothetical protein